MKTCESCKLFGAYEALAGIKNSVLLLHSVTGCNFGTLTMGISKHMDQISQCCTVINENDVILGGETSVEAALQSVWDLYHPEAVFVVSGCISSMVGDDVGSAVLRVALPCPVICIDAPGFAGGMKDGYEVACRELIALMENPLPLKKEIPEVNILGLGAGDVRLREDLKAIQKLLDGSVSVSMCISACSVEEIKRASYADLNLVFGRGITLAKKMKENFGIPYVELAYPYGITGEKNLEDVLEVLGKFPGKADRQQQAIEQLKTIYAYLQALYGSSAAIIGERARANGMKRFLEEELGIDVVCFGVREELTDLEDFYESIRKQEVAMLFGSSFELQIARELEIPLIRFDYPVFDRVSITYRPYVCAEGVPYLIEDILNEIMAEKRKEGALYQ
ncbi:nitrogenase component 1 [Parablautia sp. Marseille-Q6255]|uniref:nitrogenase component 1 n=1 Tax=Parablautia sp. Marseille-Q6255 TaxID=3039593 RepID=UPI0024BD0FF9|nr:nitrogenase component 1 [Parablautia sp. Marseille-Q6255]